MIQLDEARQESYGRKSLWKGRGDGGELGNLKFLDVVVLRAASRGELDGRIDLHNSEKVVGEREIAEFFYVKSEGREDTEGKRVYVVYFYCLDGEKNIVREAN